MSNEVENTHQMVSVGVETWTSCQISGHRFADQTGEEFGCCLDCGFPNDDSGVSGDQVFDNQPARAQRRFIEEITQE